MSELNALFLNCHLTLKNSTFHKKINEKNGHHQLQQFLLSLEILLKKKTCCNHVVYGGLPPSMPLYGKCPKALAIECWSKEIWLDIKLISFDNTSSGLYWFWCWWEEKRYRARCMVPNGGYCRWANTSQSYHRKGELTSQENYI